MFQNVFATVLLCSCVASGTRLQNTHSVPSCDNNNYSYVSNDRELKPRCTNNISSYTFSGAYCFREVIDYDYLVSEGLDLVSYDFNLAYSSLGIYIYTYDDNTLSYDVVARSLSMMWDDEYYVFSVTFANHDDDPYKYVSYNNVSFDYQDRGVQEFYIVFLEPYYCNDYDFVKVFNTFFTHQGNSYNVVYTGWYTFNATVNISSYYNFLYGYYLADNNIYNTFSWSQGWDGGVQHPYIAFSNNYLNNFYLYQNGTWNGAKVVYFTGVMIPIEIYRELSRYGVFNYVVEQQNYTFGDMVFSVMDAPIYMLSQLFSFELFGIQFYVAFMSIVTVLLICFVVRKII